MTKPLPDTLPLQTVERHGFGNYRHATQALYRPERLQDILALPQQMANASLLACGLGNSYGDAALNTGGVLASTERVNRMLSFDPERSVLRAEAGVTVLDVMRAFAPRGLTLPATPGLSKITLGGCAAFDIHSKNHWQVGGFGESVLSMQMLLADGSRLECSRQHHADLFHATLGGMGMTGIILELEVALHPLPGQTAANRSLPFEGVPALLERIAEVQAQPGTTHLVAWLDLLNQRQASGYVISSTLEDTPQDGAIWADKKAPPLGLIAPFFNRWSNKAFNLAFALKHRSQPSSKADLRSFLFPWDALPNWNLLYGRKGFVEYQCCLPFEGAQESLTRVLDYVLAHKQKFPAYFAAIKRVRDGAGMLSFPINGFSALFDFPVSKGLWGFLDQLDEIVIAAGGRVYLAKDGRVSAQAYHRMYPRIEEWQNVRSSYDPRNLFASDMARRLNLVNKDG